MGRYYSWQGASRRSAAGCQCFSLVSPRSSVCGSGARSIAKQAQSQIDFVQVPVSECKAWAEERETRLQGSGSATVPVAVRRVPRPTSSPILSHELSFGLAAFKEKAVRSVSGGKPNTACETHALPGNALARPNPLKTSRNHGSKPAPDKGGVTLPVGRRGGPPGCRARA